MQYISLGYFCSVALELEKYGLRSESSPFDWLISDFEGVISAIENHFEDFLTESYLVQDCKYREHYFNTKYKCWFFHDFDKYKSLDVQLHAVTEKYRRRIDRFYKTIESPTMFIRYISDEEQINGKSAELAYIEEYYDEIMCVLRSFNPENDILFIANEGVTSDRIKIHNVQKDKNDKVARTPISKNRDLSVLFEAAEIPEKKKNLERYSSKTKAKNRLKVIRKIKAKIKSFCMKEYIHHNQY